MLPVAAGVDTLEISFYGALRPDLIDALECGKAEAEDGQQHKVPLGGREWHIAPHGAGKMFRFLLTCDDLDLKISAGQDLNSVAIKAVFRSEFLWSFGGGARWKDAYKEVKRMLKPLFRQGEIMREQVSRCDLATDLETSFDLVDIPNFVTRAVNRRPYNSKHDPEKQERKKRGGKELGEQCSWHMKHLNFTGCQFGKGDVVGRIYNKTEEMKGKDKSVLMHKVWGLEEDPEGDDVWRVEVQMRRKKLKQKGIDTPQDLMKHSAALWDDMTDWLSLRKPSENKQRSRWREDERWKAVKSAGSKFGAYHTLPAAIERSNDRKGDQLYLQARGCLASFGAHMGLSDEQTIARFSELMIRDRTEFGKLVEDRTLRRLE